MMQAFRNSAKPVVLLITITFMLWLVLDLSGLTGSGGMFTRTTVGSVNGHDVEIRSYQQAVQNASSERQRQLGRALGLEETEQVRDEVWESFIQNAVLQAEVRDRNIEVSGQEIAEFIQMAPLPEFQNEPIFQTEGAFDITKYHAWLASAAGQQYVPVLEAQYRDEILRAKLLRNVTADIYLSDAALWQRYRDQNETVAIALTPLVANRVVHDSMVTVSPEEVDAYYRDNRAEFERPETAFLSYIAIDRALDASDSAAVMNRARELRQEIIDGALFADVAVRESADLASGADGGNLGTFGRGAMIPAFEEAAFSLPVGTVSQPIETAEGIHLIEVTRKVGDDSVEARHILLRYELAGAHRDLVDAQADSLEMLGAERLDPAALDTAARALKVPVGQAAPIQKGSAAVIGLSLLGDPAVWAFQAKVGETSPVIETEESLFVFRLDSLHSGGIPPLEQVRDAATAAVREQKKEARALQMAEELVSRVKAGESLAAASEAMGLQHREFAPFPRIQPPLPNPTLIGTVFGLPVGSLSRPIVTNEGIYVVRILDRTPADSAAFQRDFTQIQTAEINAARQERVRYFLANLRESAVIKDHRSEIFKTNAQIEAETPALPIQ